MSWWDETTGAFQEWMNDLFGPPDDQSKIVDFQALAAGKRNPDVNLPKSAWDSRVDVVLVDHEKAAGVKPAATPSPSASPKSSTGPKPVPLKGSQQSAQDLAQIIGPARTEFNAAQRQTQGTINGVDPNALVYDPTHPRYKKTQVGDPKDFAPKITKMNTRSLDDIIRDPFSWDDDKVKEVGLMMLHANLIGQGDVLNRDKIGNAWAVLASTSARMYEMGKSVSPWDLLKTQSFGGSSSLAGPKTTTSTNTNYQVTNATTAKQLAQAALSQRVGRDATDSEVAEFIKALRDEEKKNPTVQTATTTTNADGTSQTSTSTTKEGVDPSAFSRQYSQDYDTEEAAAYQSAGIMMPWLFDALKAPA